MVAVACSFQAASLAGAGVSTDAFQESFPAFSTVRAVRVSPSGTQRAAGR